MQTWAWLAKCHTEVYLASVFVTDVARTGNDENLRPRYSTCSECFPLNVPAHRNESGYLKTSSKIVSIATLHQPPHPTFGHLLPLGEGAAQRRMRGGQGLGQSHPSPGLRPPSPGGRGTKSLLPPGEGAAQRRMRGG